MQKTTTRVVLWSLAILVSAAGLGCSDAQPRNAGRAVLDAVEYAGRLLARARYLAGAPVVSAPGTGEPALLQPYGDVSPAAAAEGDLPPVGAVAPEALDALRQAEQHLAQALSDNAEAEASVKAIAEAMLGRIQSLRGDLEAARAAVARGQLDADLTQLAALAEGLRARGALQAYFQDMATPAEDDLKEIIEQSRQRLEELTADSDELTARIEKLRQQRDELTAANEQLIGQVRELRTELRLVSAEEGMDLLNEALAKEETLGENESRIATIEQQVRMFEAQGEDLTLQIASARSRMEAAEEALANRVAWAESSPGVSGLQGELAAAREKVEALAADVQAGVEKASSLQKAARSAFAQAAGHFSKAASLEARERRPEILSAAADEWMSEAGAIADQLGPQARAARVAEHVRTAWQTLPDGAEPPAVVASLEAFASGTEEARAEAVALYQRAAEQYAKAAQAAPRNGAWAYQFQQADAHIGRFLLTGDEAARQEATDALAEASEGKAESPYIRPQVAVRQRVLQGS